MLLPVNALAGLVLHAVQVLTLARSDGTVGLGLVLGPFNARLLVLQPPVFALRQGAAGLALFDALFLALLALVDAGGGRGARGRLGENGGRCQA